MIEKQVLVPFDRRDAMTCQQAAEIAGRSPETIRQWALRHDIGRHVGGRMLIDRNAFRMFIDGDRKALDAYQAGDRTGPAVVSYLERRP